MCPPGAFKFNRGRENSAGSKVTWTKVRCISIRRMCTVDLGWVNISHVISDVSEPIHCCNKWFKNAQYGKAHVIYFMLVRITLF